ncbi:MAG: helix-turn-helix domain-containing protein [Catenulispora sp.]|nr:helix-turn-helix domain-containing protein [Catenulispora sp.]
MSVNIDRRAELGEFLRSRRARLSPAELGLPDYGGRRRVPGLRREELALLAGVSVDHYVRLEQGRTLHPEFAEVWSWHDVRDKTHGAYTYRHPVVGELTLDYETLRAPDDPDQALITQTAPEGSSSKAGLRLLAAWAQTVRAG